MSLTALPVPPARVLYGGLLCAGLAAVPYALWLHGLFPALALAGVGLRALQLRRGWRPLNRWVLGFASTAGLAGVLWQFGSPVGRDAGVSLLLLMLGLKALECHQRRDVGVLILLTLFLLAAAFFFEQGMLFGLYALGVVALTLAALMGLEPERALPWPQRLRTAARMLLTAMPLMVVLFYLFPRIDSPLGVLHDPGRVASTGLSDSMQPGAFERLIESSEVAFRVRFQGRPPAPGELYWRGPVFWDYDGRVWRSHAALAAPEALETLGDPVVYTLFQPGGDQRWVLALEQAGSPPRGTLFASGRQLSVPTPVAEARQYELQGWTNYRLGHDLHPRQYRRALRLPDSAAPRTRDLVAGWLARADGMPALRDAEIVTRVLTHFREEPFRYTLRPPPLVGDPVDAFVFDTRAGFCEYYAGAFVVMMRAAGVPARVVTGYQGGEASQVAEYFLVRQSDAHAWAEVWLQGRGWVRVDPTAAVAPGRVERGLGNALADDAGLPGFLRRDARSGWQHQFNALRDAADYQWTAWVLGFSEARQSDLLRALGLERFGFFGIVVGLLAALAGLAFVYLGAAWLKSRRHPPAPEERARAQVLRALARHGLAPRPDEGPSDFSERAAVALPRYAAALHAFNRAYVAARFGADIRAQQLSALQASARALVRALRSA